MILEQTIGLVVDLSRQGEPAIVLRDAVVTPETWVLPPVLPADDIVVMYAHGGSGKSYLAQALAISVQSGRSVFPAPLGDPPTARNVLYLDWETAAAVQKHRMECLWYGAGERGPAPAVRYMRCAPKLIDLVPHLQQTIADHAIAYLIVDSIGPSCGGDLNDAATALEWFRALRSLNVGVLAVAHMPKEGDSVLGSVMWENLPRAVWRVVPDANLEGALTVTFRLHKGNNLGKQKPFSYTLHFEPGSVAITAAR